MPSAPRPLITHLMQDSLQFLPRRGCLRRLLVNGVFFLNVCCQVKQASVIVQLPAAVLRPALMAKGFFVPSWQGVVIAKNPTAGLAAFPSELWSKGLTVENLTGRRQTTCQLEQSGQKVRAIYEIAVGNAFGCCRPPTRN
jgi:hypothetical protein